MYSTFENMLIHVIWDQNLGLPVLKLFMKTNQDSQLINGWFCVTEQDSGWNHFTKKNLLWG